eukprot:gb/GECH01014934.1/.p1 GENE.gb/GECH01014934.1/~~gb/GECH01014934.1/.p1  ORF type:complete len:294 (+),score=52.67 gb/GECH01014934.1/:1-882(+)
MVTLNTHFLTECLILFFLLIISYITTSEAFTSEQTTDFQEGRDASSYYNRGVFNPSLLDYYKNLHSGKNFKEDLHNLLSNNTQVLSYHDVWHAFNVTDVSFPSCGQKIRDIYAKQCWIYGKNQCGNYHREGDCYNREHSWPKSWWGSAHNDAYTDIHHLYPADGYVNNRRANLPLGVVTQPSYVSSDGSKSGKCDPQIFRGKCFEPSDSFKGEIARTYFYMSVRYMNVFRCCDMQGVNGSNIKPWMEQLLRQWHEQYPPTDSERHRNDVVYRLQRNRNPFVDHPEWVSKIQDF